MSECMVMLAKSLQTLTLDRVSFVFGLAYVRAPAKLRHLHLATIFLFHPNTGSGQHSSIDHEIEFVYQKYHHALTESLNDSQQFQGSADIRCKPVQSPWIGKMKRLARSDAFRNQDLISALARGRLPDLCRNSTSASMNPSAKQPGAQNPPATLAKVSSPARRHAAGPRP